MILVHVEWFVIGSKTDLESRQNDKYMKTQKKPCPRWFQIHPNILYKMFIC